MEVLLQSFKSRVEAEVLPTEGSVYASTVCYASLLLTDNISMTDGIVTQPQSAPKRLKSQTGKKIVLVVTVAVR